MFKTRIGESNIYFPYLSITTDKTPNETPVETQPTSPKGEQEETKPETNEETAKTDEAKDNEDETNEKTATQNEA